MQYNSAVYEFPAATTFAQLLGTLKTAHAIPCPLVKYLDEESELITVENQVEFQEGLDCQGKFIVHDNLQESSTLAGLPLVESCMESFAAPPLKRTTDKANYAAVASRDVALGRKQQDAFSATATVEVAEIALQPIGTDSYAKLSGPDLVEKAQNTLPRQSQLIGTEPASTNSVSSATNQLSRQHRESQANTQNVQEQIRGLVRQELSLSLEQSRVRGSVVRCVFEGAKCCVCGNMPIVNVLYSCEQCQEVVMCESCEEDFEHAHDLVKHRNPEGWRKSDNKSSALEYFKRLGFMDEEKIREALEQAEGQVNRAASILLNLD